jgi:serine protease
VVAGAPGDLPPGLNAIKHLKNADLTIVAAPRGGEIALAKQLRKKGRRAGVNRIAYANATVNDPTFSLQWHFQTVQAQSAWDTSTGSGVVVAVLDTGLATAGASDGIGCTVSGTDTVNNDNSPLDDDGHGTHVAGTIAQQTQNGVGVAGLAYSACIMPVKVLDDSGSGSFADIADGMYFAVNNGADVINMSLGTDAKFQVRNDPFMDPALDYAYSNDVTVVCSAGNESQRKNVGYPAIYPTTIGVGATDYRDRVPRYSNKGDGLDIVAPGGDNTRDDNGDGYADGVLQETFDGTSWGYYFFSGTSMASPHVAAAAALLISSGVATSPDAVFNALTSTAKDLGNSGYDSTHGWGLLQAADALVGPPPPPPCTDSDGDGFCAEDGDCDDSDAAVNPSATEVCDGIDNDCDGTVDEGCGGGCIDNDGDGWCIEDGDCDDSDPNIHPGRPDKGGRWGRDGLDNDCNGVIDG